MSDEASSKLDRRKFLGAATLAGAGIALSPKNAIAQSVARPVA